jgi:hypothetical protein
VVDGLKGFPEAIGLSADRGADLLRISVMVSGDFTRW